MDDKPIILKPNNIYYEIYQLLWLRTNKLTKNKFSFSVPDTVLFNDNVPSLWIFTSKSGHIKRKRVDKLSIKEVYNKFYNESKLEVIGYYFYLDTENISLIPEEVQDDNPLVLYFKQLGIDLNEKRDENRKIKIAKNMLKFEILRRENFKEFMDNFKKRLGILQIYVESNFDPNTLFKVMWSKNKSICEMRSSRQSFYAQNAHFFEKVVTYETEKFNIQSSNEKNYLRKSAFYFLREKTKSSSSRGYKCIAYFI
jgi:hypothetical protein